MMQTKGRNAMALKAVVYNAVEGLSARARATLMAHPDAVRSALAVAANALSIEGLAKIDSEVIGGEETLLVSPEEAGRRIAIRTQTGKKEDLLSSAEIADKTGLKTRQSIHDWLKKGKIIGWQGAKRGYVFPAAQLDERGQPLKGLDRVVPNFEDSYGAWVWLTTPRAAFDGVSPLSVLSKGETDPVIRAAKGDSLGDFV